MTLQLAGYVSSSLSVNQFFDILNIHMNSGGPTNSDFNGEFITWSEFLHYFLSICPSAPNDYCSLSSSEQNSYAMDLFDELNNSGTGTISIGSSPYSSDF